MFRRRCKFIYRVIRKSLRDFRSLRYSSRDGHAEGERVNRGTDTPRFCPTLQVLDMSTLGDAADVNPLIKFLPHTCIASGYCTAEVGNPGGTYELPCTKRSVCLHHRQTWLDKLKGSGSRKSGFSFIRNRKIFFAIYNLQNKQIMGTE